MSTHRVSVVRSSRKVKNSNLGYERFCRLRPFWNNSRQCSLSMRFGSSLWWALGDQDEGLEEDVAEFLWCSRLYTPGDLTF